MICRNNKPLVSLCLRLIGLGIPAKIRGRDIGQGLVKLVKSAKGDTVGLRLTEILETTTAKAIQLEERGKDFEADSLRDKREAIQAIAKPISPSSPWTTLVVAIERLLSDESSPITLSTIHKAKGLEWERVWFLDPQLLPSRFATTDDARQQEHNLAYVAITRAKKSLFYIRSTDR